MKKLLIFLLLILLAGFSRSFFFYQSQIEKDSNQKISLNIEMGTPVSVVAEILKKEGIIEKTWPFFLYLKLNNLEGKVQAGDFIFQKPTGLRELFEQLGNAKQKEIRLIVPEGSTIFDIDEILASKGLIKDGEFETCAKECSFPNYNFFYDGNLEGYLFPDTYFVPTATFSVESFAKRLLDNFRKKVWTEEFRAEYKAQGKSLEEIVIMASLLERESRNFEEMKIVSGILWKRLEEGIALGVDATTRYYKGDKSGILLKSDFTENTPYNTRLNKGLPPTAIANPGLEALTAALYPKDSEYYYYLHDSNGQIHYSKTNEEHNLKRFKYLK